MPAKILLARISAAHGIRGEVKLQVFAEHLGNLTDHGPLQTGAGGVIEITRLKPAKDHVIASLKGVTDRNQAEALRGTELSIDRAKLPDPGDGQVYAQDLIGLPVYVSGGERFGDIVAVQNFGAGDLLEIETGGGTVFVPYTEDYVVAEDEQHLTIDLPQGYLDADEGSRHSH